MTKSHDFGPRVDMESRQLRYVSASAITEFDPTQYGGCNRSYYFSAVLGRKKPKTEALDIGGEVHRQVEHYEKTGEDVLGPIARQGKHWIPKPGPGILIEYEFGGGGLYLPSWDGMFKRFYRPRPRQPTESDADYAEVLAEADAAAKNKAFVQVHADWKLVQDAVAEGEITQVQADEWRDEHVPSSALVAHGVPFVGYIDVVNERDHWLDDAGEPQPMPANQKEVLDYKTSGNIEAYGKKAKDLPHTDQMPIYGEWVRRQYPDVEQIRLSHGYLQTRGRGAEKRTVLITLDALERRWRHVEEQVLRMTQVVREVDVAHVEPNLASCNSFGRFGCPHKDVCPRTPDQVKVDLYRTVPLSAAQTPITGVTMSSMFDTLKALTSPTTSTPSQTQAAAPPQQAQPSPPPTVLPTAAPDAVAAARTALLAAEAAASAQALAQPVCGGCGQAVTPGSTSTTNDGVVWHMVSPPHALVVTPPQLLGLVAAGGAAPGLAETGSTTQQVVPTQTMDAVANAPASSANMLTALQALSATAVAVVPPDAPASAPPGNAVAVPPGTALSPAVAAAVAQHASTTNPMAMTTDQVMALNDLTIARHLAVPARNPLALDAPLFSSSVVGSATPAVLQSGSGGSVAPPLTPSGMECAQTVSIGIAPAGPATTISSGVGGVTGGLAADKTITIGTTEKKTRGKRKAVAETDDGDLALFVGVNCFMVEVRDLEPWIAELAAKLASKYGLRDVRLGEGDHPLAFGKWKAHLADAVRADPPKGWCHIAVDGCELKQVVVNALRPLAVGGFFTR